MRRLVVILGIAFTALTLRAELDEMNLNGSFTYGFKSKMPGVRLSFRKQNDFNTRWLLAMDYTIPKNHLTCYALSYEYNYLLEVGSRVRLYTVSGAGIALWHDDRKETEEKRFYNFGDDNKVVLSIGLGAGAEVLINRHWLLNVEGKYQFMKQASQPIIIAGIGYRF